VATSGPQTPPGDLLARLMRVVEAADDRELAVEGAQAILAEGLAHLPLAEVAEVVAAFRASSARWFAGARPVECGGPGTYARRPGRCGYGHVDKAWPTDRAELPEHYGRRRRHARDLPLPQPDRAAVGAALAALVVEARRAHSQTEWIDKVAEDPDLVTRKADRRRNVAKVVLTLALFARWYAADSEGEEMTTRPTWRVLIERTGLSRSTVADILAWLRSRGWLAVVETGTTEAIRAGLLFPLPDIHAGEGSRSAVYLLCVPTTPASLASIIGPRAGDRGPADPAEDGQAAASTAGQDGLSDDVAAVTRRPAQDHDSSVGTNLGPLRSSGAAPPAETPAGASRAREEPSGDPDKDHYIRTKGSSRRGGGGLGSVPPCGRSSGRARLRASQDARAVNPVLRSLSGRHVRSVLTPWWRAGWTTADVLGALDRRPDGTVWPHAYASADLRHVAAWITHRLSAWLAPDGQPIMSPSQRQARDARNARDAQAAMRADREAAVASASWNVRHKADLIRQALAAPPQRRAEILAALDPTGPLYNVQGADRDV
jgi:hypothetical protein